MRPARPSQSHINQKELPLSLWSLNCWRRCAVSSLVCSMLGGFKSTIKYFGATSISGSISSMVTVEVAMAHNNCLGPKHCCLAQVKAKCKSSEPRLTSTVWRRCNFYSLCSNMRPISRIVCKIEDSLEGLGQMFSIWHPLIYVLTSARRGPENLRPIYLRQAKGGRKEISTYFHAK